MRSGAVVVSSDRKIQDAARRAGSAVLTAEQFLEALEVPESSSAPDIKDDSDGEPVRAKRGNPRRLSKKARKAQRALGRLRQP